MSAPNRPPDRVRYGDPEIVGVVKRQVVDVPGVFLAAPPRTLAVRTEETTVWKRKRIEYWDEPEGTLARYEWVPTEGEEWRRRA